MNKINQLFKNYQESQSSILTLMVFDKFTLTTMNNRSQQRKVKPCVRIIEPDREGNSGSDLESLLVSSVQYDPGFSQCHSDIVAENANPSPHIQTSLIKKNFNNVYVQESHRCKCDQNIDSINNSIRLLQLKLQQLQSKINICFNKQASIYSQFSQHQKQYEQYSHQCWELSSKLRDQNEKSISFQELSKIQLAQIDQELHRFKKILSRYQNRQSQKCLESRLVEHKLQKYKQQQNQKINILLSTVEQIGSLQKRMITCNDVTNTYPDDPINCSLPLEIPSKCIKILKGCTVGRKSTCQSTNISYSRNLDTSK